MRTSQCCHMPTAQALLRTFVAVVLCAGLMIPTNLTTSSLAYADGGTSELRHGTVTISSEDATGDVINLKVGDTATVSVSPYAHMQYKGCGKSDCPEDCESEHGVQCFVTGMGCKCDHAAVERTANVNASVADPTIATAGSVVPGSSWNNSDNLDLHDSTKSVTKDATITLTAVKAGTTTLTVSAATDENGATNSASGNTSTLLEFWHPATKTYTVNVTDDSTPSTQPSYADLESDHDYASNTDKTWTYTWDDASTYGMALTFDDQTKTESNYDFITIMDGDDNVVGKYSGTELSGKTVYVPQSSTTKIQLTSDGSSNYWGFKVTNVVKLTSNSLSLVATVDPISPQFLADGATPEPVVHYGSKVLTKGTDYTVSYENNTVVGDAKVVVTGTGNYTGKVERAFKVVDENNLADGVAVKADQTVVLRQSGDEGSTSVSLTGASDEWANVVTGVTVKSMSGNDSGTEQTLSADQFSVNVSSGKISFKRTEDKPVFSVAVGEGDPVTVSSRWGSTTYPQSKQYQITVKATGYKDVTGTVTFCTGAADTFSIIVDADGNDKTTDDQTVAKVFTKAEIEAMSTFQNGSSQCGMTGFRTFSAKGVALSDLIASAGVTVSETDAFKLDTTDDFGRTWTYSQLFGDRYFLQSIYDDQEVKDTYAKLVQSDDEAGATVQLRKLLATKALEDNSIAKPMMSANYVETMISSDEVATAVLPTEENTQVNQLVGQENQYRFTYGISLVKEDHTVTFNSNGGSEVASQTVQSNLMTSTENTTIRSTYWNNALVIYRNAAEAPTKDTNPEQLTVPENPTREGYTFAGWYTKDGSQDGDWGSLFNFTDNNGTVDVDTQLYAKWVENGKLATQVSHSSQAYRESQYGEQPNGDSSNAGQHVRTVLTFGEGETVAITDADALAKSLNVSVTGAQKTTFSAEGNTLVIDSTLGFALMGGSVNISAVSSSGVLDGVTAGDKLIKLDSIMSAVDTGLVFEPVSVTAGTSTTPASTTFRVTHSANVRSMNHVVWLTNATENGASVDDDSHSILSGDGNWAQSTTAHHHLWYKFTPSASAVSIVQNASDSLAAAGYTVSTTAAVGNSWDTTVDNGGLFTITANTAREGEILSAYTYTDSFFTANDLALGEKVDGVKTPAATPSVDLGMKVDMGDEGYETVSTNMGKNPAGKVDFSLVASDEALSTYQNSHEGATMKDMLQVWAQNISKVTIDGVELEGKAFDEWKSELSDPSSDANKLLYYQISAGKKKATLTLPIALFDQSSEKSTKTVAIESNGFVTFTGDVTYRNIGANDVVVRILSDDGSTVEKAVVLSADQLKNLTVQQHYNTSANCGMAGLRSFNSEGVLLSDVLAAAGVEFSEGMTLKLRVNDYLDANGDASTTEDGYANNGYTYEDLYGTSRYYYPAMWDNTTTYTELDGKTIYEVLSADMNAWKGDSEQAKFLAQKLGETKQAVQPILAWSWNEGVVAWGGTNPAEAESYNAYTNQESFRFLYGLTANEDGSAADESTTFSNVYAVFGIDIIGGKAVEPDVQPDVQPDVKPDVQPSKQTDANGNGQTMAATGDSMPVALFACAFGSALLLIIALVARRRSLAAQTGTHVRKR